MATLLGTTSLGANSSNQNLAGTAFAQRLQALADGTVTSLSLRGGATGPSAGALHAALYADNAGSLSGASRLSGDITGNFVSNGVITFAVSPGVPVVAGTFYWIEWLGTGAATNYTDNATSGGTERDTTGQTSELATHATTTASFTNYFNTWAEGTLGGGAEPSTAYKSDLGTPLVRFPGRGPAGFMEQRWAPEDLGVALTRVAAEIDVLYDILSAVSETNDVRYDVLNAVAQTRDLLYNLLNRTSQTRDLRYDIIGRISQVRDVRYDILARIAQTRDLRYNILNVINQTRDLRYDILAKASQTRDVRYDIAGRIAALRDVRYDILTRTSQTRDLRYNLLNRTSQTRDVLYNILTKASQTRDVRYDLIAKVSEIRNIVYQILSDDIVVTGHPPFIRHRTAARQPDLPEL